MAPTPIPVVPRIPDVPLPGMYECITAQVNVTLHPRLGTVKYVVTMRDPSPNRQVELSREGGQCSWNNLHATLRDHVDRLCSGMEYLAAMPSAPPLGPS